MIDNAGLDDRLDEDPQGTEGLMASIREYGQQVPVLLRQSSRSEGRYDVVFGRRRVAAMRRLGMPVKAMARSLNDRKLVVAQGQENSARKDLSFIEKANFARQMVAAGYDRKLVCDALSIDKTVISRMLSVIELSSKSSSSVSASKTMFSITVPKREQVAWISGSALGDRLMVLA